MAYPTLAEIKSRLSITDSSQDSLLQLSLGTARSAVESYCGYEWPSMGPASREFKRAAQARGRSLFDVSYPGLLSWTGAQARRRYSDVGQVISTDAVELLRYQPGGAGPFARFVVDGDWSWVSITGAWGQGTEPPDEVAEAVMIVASSIYANALGGGDLEGAPVNAADFDDGLVGFLLKGHRRAR